MARGRFSVIGAAFAVAVAMLFALAACDNAQHAGAPPNEYELAVAAMPGGEAVVNSSYVRTLATGTVRELTGFIELYPEAPEVPVAQFRIEQLRQDRSVWEPVAASGDEQQIRTFLFEYPGHVAEAEARALLAPFEGIDLYELIAAGAVSVEATGAGVAAVSVSLRNLTAEPIRAIVPAGAYFKSDGSVQNMVTTETRTVWLPVGEAPTTAFLTAACANLHLAEPFGQHGLTLAAEPVSGDVARVVAAAAGLDLAARQAAVWIMTDDATYSELTVLNTMTASYALAGARLVAESGADLKTRRIWESLPQLFAESLYAGHEDDALWAWNAMGRPLQPDPQDIIPTPYLATAAECGCLRVMDALIEAGADVNQRFELYDRETSVIARSANRATAERLIAAGAELDGRDLWERVALSGLVDLAAFLVERGEPPPSDLPLLVRADGDVEMIRILLDNGAPVNLADANGDTPLHAAASSVGAAYGQDNREAVALLLAAGANPNAINGLQWSVTRVAIDLAINDGDTVAIVTQLLAAGADPQDRDYEGNTLLHAVAYVGGDVNLIPVLVEAGIDPNAVNDRGWTPLHTVAAGDGYYATDLAAALIAAGARRVRDENGQLPEDLIPPDAWAAKDIRTLLLTAPEQGG